MCTILYQLLDHTNLISRQFFCKLKLVWKIRWIHSFTSSTEATVLQANYTLSMTCAIPLLSPHVHSFTLLILSLKSSSTFANKVQKGRILFIPSERIVFLCILLYLGYCPDKKFFIQILPVQSADLPEDRLLFKLFHLKPCNFSVIIQCALFQT